LARSLARDPLNTWLEPRTMSNTDRVERLGPNSHGPIAPLRSHGRAFSLGLMLCDALGAARHDDGLAMKVVGVRI